MGRGGKGAGGDAPDGDDDPDDDDPDDDGVCAHASVVCARSETGVSATSVGNMMAAKRTRLAR